MGTDHDTANLYAAGVTVQELYWGRIFRGDEAALVAAGLVQSEWLPGKPGSNKVSITVVFEDGKARLLVGKGRGTSRGDYIKIMREGKDRYLVSKKYSHAEIESRDIQDKIREARDKEAKKMAELPANFNAYRAEILGVAEMFLDGIRIVATSPENSGYSFAHDFLAVFDIAAGQILGAIQTGKIDFDRAQRSAVIAKIHHNATEEKRKADPEFSAFLEATLASAKAAIHASNGGAK